MMPVDQYGNRAEMIMDPTSIPGRMNPSNLYEQYFNGISRRIKHLVTTEVNKLGGLDNLDNVSIENVFSIILNGIEHFGTEQYDVYKNTNIEEKLEIIKDVYNKEAYIYYKVSSNKKPYEVVASVTGTIYEPVYSKLVMQAMDSPEPKWSKKDVLIAPQYIILLAKTPEYYLATSSAKTNHYDFPVSVGPKLRQNLPYRNSPVKMLSETETRLYTSYVGQEAVAEMKDRANSVQTHKIVYENILKSETPTNVDSLVNRKEHPFGTDKAIEIVESVLNSSGIELEYVDEK